MTTAWTKIKADFLNGMTPKEIAKKYKIKAKAISDKAWVEKWNDEKSKIIENVRENTESRIKDLTNKAFNALEQVLDDECAKYQDKVAAARAIIDVSGLKKEKQEVKNLTPQIVVADAKHKDLLEQIKNADIN